MKGTTILLILLVFLGTSMIFSNIDNGRVEEVDDFPIGLSAEEWGNMTPKERIAQLQIPKDALNAMSTKALVEVCWNYPFAGNMLFHNSLQEGFENVVAEFNGLQELMRRQDAGKELLKKYQSFEPAFIHEEIQKGNYGMTFKPLILEVLLSQEEIISTLTDKEKYALAGEAFKKFHLKELYPETYGYLGLNPPGVIMKRVMESKGFPTISKEKEIPVSYGGIDEENIEQILSQTEKFLIEK